MLTEEQIEKIKFRGDVTVLLADREELVALLSRALEALKDNEWFEYTESGEDGEVDYKICPTCRNEHCQDHAIDCLRYNAIREIKEAVKNGEK